MLVHSVLFWLKDSLSEKERKDFVSELYKLKEIEVVKDLYVGGPSPSERPVVEKSYTFGLTVLLEDLKAHDEYQSHPVHQNFLQKHSSMWTKVLVFDPDSHRI